MEEGDVGERELEDVKNLEMEEERAQRCASPHALSLQQERERESISLSSIFFSFIYYLFYL